MDTGFELSLTPRGHLVALSAADAPALAPDLVEVIGGAFSEGAGPGLWVLGSRVVGTALPEPWSWWRDLAARFVAAVCAAGEAATAAPVEPPEAGERQRLCWSVPPMRGAEYLDDEVLVGLWEELDVAFKAALARHEVGTVDALLQDCHPSWHLVGRVHVHLAENRKDSSHPFAFLVTYTADLSRRGRARHLPLAQALEEFAGRRERLLALLEPLSIAAGGCPWLQALLDSREIFHPLRWSAAEALQFLRDADELRRAGVVVRLPVAWRSGRPSRVTAGGTVGDREPSRLDAAALLDFRTEVAIDGEALDQDEIDRLLAGADGLQLIRGRWVEVDREHLRRTLERFSRVEALAREGGLGFHEAMRLLASGGVEDDGEQADETADWATLRAGAWLEETLCELRRPSAAADVPPGLEAELRPYQLEGLRWLHLLSRLRLGACLADDMGLGKTMQVLALLLVRRDREGPAPSLLVAPASLLANWEAEATRFAPDLRVRVAHGSAMSREELEGLEAGAFAGVDMVVVSYGSLHRWAWLTEVAWRLVILDEAQAIKNRSTRQTRAAKKLPAASRIILTGTPVENHLGDLWSLFDFVNPGLLGTAKAFTAWTKRLRDAPDGYAPLRRLVQPYLLRRLKTDKAVIADLPDKVEQTVWCALSRRQGALYRRAVEELAGELAAVDGIKRKGLVLAYLLRFKQLCNHPSQWLGDDGWEPEQSGKFARLDELCETIADRQEKALVFTQFRETTAPLAAHLGERFGRQGLVLTGATPVGKRRELVRRFQEDEAVPFFVISLKAGGSGLNLTAANHVIHFDRWWNPAVENQATDRAFRIGQHRNVLVHKFTCRGTIEERIAEMIAEKQALADELFDTKGEIRLTELGDDELLDLVRLDATAAESKE